MGHNTKIAAFFFCLMCAYSAYYNNVNWVGNTLETAIRRTFF